jgi:hypothetical protein
MEKFAVLFFSVVFFVSLAAATDIMVDVHVKEGENIDRENVSRFYGDIEDYFTSQGLDVNMKIADFSYYDSGCVEEASFEDVDRKADVSMCIGSGEGGFYGAKVNVLGANTDSPFGFTPTGVHAEAHEIIHFLGFQDLYGYPESMPKNWNDKSLMEYVYYENPELADITKKVVKFNLEQQELGRKQIFYPRNTSGQPDFKKVRIPEKTILSYEVGSQDSCKVYEIHRYREDKLSDPMDFAAVNGSIRFTVADLNFDSYGGIKIECGSVEYWSPSVLYDQCFLDGGVPEGCSYSCETDGNWCSFEESFEVNYAPVISREVAFEALDQGVRFGAEFSDPDGAEDIEECRAEIRYREAEKSLSTDPEILGDKAVQCSFKFLEAERGDEIEVEITASDSQKAASTEGEYLYPVKSNFSVDKEEVVVERIGINEKSFEISSASEKAQSISFYASSEKIAVEREIILGPRETKQVSVNLDVKNLEDSEETLVLESNLSDRKEMEISIESPECALLSNGLCIGKSQVEVQRDARGNFTRSIEIRRVKETGGVIAVSLNGNVSRVAEVQDELDLSTSNELEIEFSPENPGSYTGSLDLGDRAEVPVLVEANFRPRETEISLSPEEISLGEVVEGIHKINFSVINEGSSRIESIRIGRQGSRINGKDVGIEPGKSENFSVNLEIESGNEKLTVSAASDYGEAEESLTIRSEAFENYGPRIRSLRNELGNIEKEELRQEVAENISRAEEAWSADNYSKAEKIYSSTRREVKQQLVQDQGSTLFKPINIAGGLIILFLAFTAYTSIVPED